MSLALNRLVKRLRRRYPAAPIQFIAVWERHRSGYPHLHLLARAPYIPQPVLSAMWRDLTGAPIVDIRPSSSSHGSARYIAKYLTKHPDVPAGMRHFRTSRRFWLTPGGLFGRSAPRNQKCALRFWPLAAASTYYPSQLFELTWVNLDLLRLSAIARGSPLA